MKLLAAHISCRVAPLSTSVVRPLYPFLSSHPGFGSSSKHRFSRPYTGRRRVTSMKLATIFSKVGRAMSRLDVWKLAWTETRRAVSWSCLCEEEESEMAGRGPLNTGPWKDK